MDALAASTVNVKLAAARRNGLIGSEEASNLSDIPNVRVPGVERRGIPVGNGLTKEQANDLLNAPSSKTLIGKRDRAILALLIGCGLRRAELLRLDVNHLQQRDARWVVSDLLGKGNRVRTVTIPAGVKARIDLWTAAASIGEGRLFRPVTKAGVVQKEVFRMKRRSGAWWSGTPERPS